MDYPSLNPEARPAPDAIPAETGKNRDSVTAALLVVLEQDGTSQVADADAPAFELLQARLALRADLAVRAAAGDAAARTDLIALDQLLGDGLDAFGLMAASRRSPDSIEATLDALDIDNEVVLVTTSRLRVVFGTSRRRILIGSIIVILLGVGLGLLLSNTSDVPRVFVAGVSGILLGSIVAGLLNQGSRSSD